MYRIDNLKGASFIRSHGHPVTLRHSDGDEFMFEFAIDPEEAQRLLATREFKACAQYHRAWRELRRLIDVARAAQG